MSKMVKCKTCGADIASNAKTCPSCGAKNKNRGNVKLGLILIIVGGIVFIAGIAGSGDNGNTTSPTPNNEVVSTKISEFSGDCGIMASAEMGCSIIGMPELTVSIKNNGKKDISAVKFYVVPYDVYGEEITGWTSQNNLYTDTTIKAGKSNTISYQFIEDSVKTVKLYVYSVYYADGTEWGNKDATKSTILNNASVIEVYGES